MTGFVFRNGTEKSLQFVDGFFTAGICGIWLSEIMGLSATVK
jgi:hypothetical protein